MAVIVITLQPVDEEVLGGADPSPLTITATGNVEPLTYQWYMDETVAFTSPTLIVGATSASYTPTTEEGDTEFFRCTVGASDCTPTTQVTDIVAVEHLFTVFEITVQPVGELVAGGESPADITVTAVTEGAEPITYMWMYSPVSPITQPFDMQNSTDTLTSAEIEALVGVGAEGYFYCVLEAVDCTPDSLTTDVVRVFQNGLLPVIPEYLTGEFVIDYIGQCSLEVQARFVSEQARTGITFADDDTALRTAQIELFMKII